MNRVVNEYITKPARQGYILLNNLTEGFLRFIVTKVVPIKWQYFLRDIGFMQYFGDFGAYLIGFGLAIFKPALMFDLLKTRRNMKTIKYSSKLGNYNMEIMDFSQTTSEGSIKRTSNPRPLFVFVHGGAWGSGRMWQYCLIAKRYGNMLKASHVINIGYPLYPQGTVLDQRDAVKEALQYIHTNQELSHELGLSDGKKPVILAGHSSGANISALALIDCYQQNIPTHVDLFIGLSGVYDVEQHYAFESLRGVQHVSPMAAAANGPDNFWECSPTLVINKLLESEFFFHQGLSHRKFPFVGLIHGEEDQVVPIHSSQQFEIALGKLGGNAICRYPQGYDHIAPLLHVLGEEDNDTIDNIRYIWNHFLNQV